MTLNATHPQSPRYTGPSPVEEDGREADLRRAAAAEAVALYRAAHRRVRTLLDPPAPAPPARPVRKETRYAYPSRGKFNARGWHDGKFHFFGTFAIEAEAKAESLRRITQMRESNLESPLPPPDQG
jgi:hypothetical protein